MRKSCPFPQLALAAPTTHMFRFRAISSSATHYAAKPLTIKKFPVALRISFPLWDMPTSVNFTSFEHNTEFLEPQKLLRDPTAGNALRASEVEKIDPGIVYDIIGTGFPFHSKGLSREQVIGRVFEGKSSLALRRVLEEKDQGVSELPRVIRDKKGKVIAEWEAIFKLSDDSFIFLEAKYRMSKVSQYLKILCTKLELHFVRCMSTSS
jgi:hypothetical protein